MSRETVTERTADPIIQRVWHLAEPWLGAERVELDDVEMVGVGRGRTLRILVDHPEGIDLDRIAALSDGLSRLLDDLPALADPYQLEVSSPGLERKLRRPRHWEKAVGAEVSVKVRTSDAHRTHKGRLASFDGERITLSLGGDDTQQVEFSIGDVATAKTVFRWEKAPKPGKK